MDDQQAHLRYVIPMAPYGSRSETFFSAAAGDEEILGELRRAEAAHDAAAAAHYRLLPLRRPDGLRKRSRCSRSLSRRFPTRTVTA